MPDATGSQQLLEQARGALGREDYEAGERFAREALHAQPQNAEALWVLGLAVWQGRSDARAAATYLGQSLKLHPNPRQHVPFAMVLADAGRLDEASAVLRSADDRATNDPRALYLLANLHFRLGGLRAAETYARRALELAKSPRDRVAAHLSLAAAMEVIRPQEAVDNLVAAIELAPQYALSHARLSETLLRYGKWTDGWREYPWHRLVPQDVDDTFSNLPGPSAQVQSAIWQGQELAGATVIVTAQREVCGTASAGAGDRIMMARYVPLLAERGATVFFECMPELHSLLATVPGLRPIWERSITARHLIPIWDLPMRFGTQPDTVPSAQQAYVSADPGKVAAWRARLASEVAFRVGLVWAGNPQFAGDRFRSSNPTMYAPLAEVPGVKLFSLQKGPGAALLEPVRSKLPFTDYSSELHDFSDTAALIANLDLVITTDTSVCHLAGALGAQVWTLLPFISEWRWMHHAQRTVWYPNMRLYRQPAPRDWGNLIKRVVQDLRTACCQAITRA